MKNVLIVEDGETTRKRLCELVKAVSSEVNVYDFDSIKGVYDFIFNHTIDLFLVDIILYKDVKGDVSGLRLVDEIRKIPRYEFTPVVFITSVYDSAMYAYSNLHTYKYIEKPFDDETVKNVIAGALRFPKIEQADKMLYFRMEGTFYTIKCSEVLYIESLEHKIHVHKVDCKTLVAPYKAFDQIMLEAEGAGLVQCSRNVIINKSYVEYIDWANGCLKLKNVEAPMRIGITYKHRIKRMQDDL